MGPRAVEEGVAQQRPQLQPAAQGVKIAHAARLLEGDRIRVRAREQIDCARRPESDRQSPRREGEVAQNRILNRHGRPVECGEGGE